jgi:hypothetical protein
MFVNDAGKAAILERKIEPVLERRYYNRSTVDHFKRFYSNRRVLAGCDDKNEPIYINPAIFWLNHPNRRQYLGGVVFWPGQAVPADTFNLWEGFAVMPSPDGSYAAFDAHLGHIICRDHPGHYDWLFKSLARMVQHPGERGEIIVLLQGEEGAGKSLLGRVMRRLLGPHALVISDPRHLVGAFNSHLRDCIFLMCDEMFYAGDRTQEAKLKSLIEETLAIEGKFENTVQAPNFLHVLLTTNRDWAIPASLKARRFFVLDVSGERVGDNAYFKNIWRELEAGGYARLLHDLITCDLTDFNHRKAPETKALQEQKKLSLKTHEVWWQDVLHRGYVFQSRLGLDEYFRQWHDKIAADLMHESYSNFARQRREPYPLSRETLGRFLRQMGYRRCQPTNLVVSEHITDVLDAQGHPTGRKAAALFSKKRGEGYRLGSLSHARRMFAKATGLAVDWAGKEQG